MRSSTLEIAPGVVVRFADKKSAEAWTSAQALKAAMSEQMELKLFEDKRMEKERAEKINNVFKVETGSEGKAKFVEQIDTKFQLSASTPRMVALFLFIVTN